MADVCKGAVDECLHCGTRRDEPCSQFIGRDTAMAACPNAWASLGVVGTSTANAPQAVRDAAKLVEDYFRNVGRLVWTLGGVQSVQQRDAGIETVTWVLDDQPKPNDERTVLINVVAEDVALVRDGFWSDGKWHDGDGWEIRQSKVVAWSEKPKGLVSGRAGG